ncbi:hypothetical protein GEOBRER4_n3552 [Citrifermentans bremense]|uniref:Uncharacterized protein n=1 Tax=Citrifermentans bremense TaxID=60035 RepID=A0A6S6M9X2_9BACT|nr:WD40 repeat domain-containing protein [Citrifermentans bremense]BCG48656.1 hypothetical protein GEOBRER4_n3552 [Citrifermentans bremense]
MKYIAVYGSLFFLLVSGTACDKTPANSSQSAFNDKSAKLAVAPEGYELGEKYFSPDGRHVAMLASKAGQSFVILDSEINGGYAAINDQLFSKYRGDFAFVATEGNKQRVIANGKAGKAFDGIGRPFFTPDGRIIYDAKAGGKWLIVAGDRESAPFDSANPTPILSDDGKRLAYTEQNGATRKIFLRLCSSDLSGCASRGDYDAVGELAADASRTRLCYTVTKDGKNAVVTVDLKQPGLTEKPGGWYDEILAAKLSEGGEHLAYLARRGKSTVLVKDGAEMPVSPVETVFDLVVAKNGRTLYTAMLKEKVAAFVDGKQAEKVYDEISGVSFSPDGTLHAYAATSGQNAFVVVNGVEGPKYDKVVSPRFTPDGSRLVYRARKAGERFAVTADPKGQTIKEHPHYEAVWDLAFSPDGKSVGYGVKIGQEFWWKVEKL